MLVATNMFVATNINFVATKLSIFLSRPKTVLVADPTNDALLSPPSPQTDRRLALDDNMFVATNINFVATKLSIFLSRPKTVLVADPTNDALLSPPPPPKLTGVSLWMTRCMWRRRWMQAKKRSSGEAGRNWVWPGSMLAVSSLVSPSWDSRVGTAAAHAR